MNSRQKPPINHKSIERWENEGGARKKKRPRDPNQPAKVSAGIAAGGQEDREPTARKAGQGSRRR